MAKVLQCDRCGNYGNFKNFYQIGAKKYLEGHRTETLERSADLCEKCMIEMGLMIKKDGRKRDADAADQTEMV